MGYIKSINYKNVVQKWWKRCW